MKQSTQLLVDNRPFQMRSGGVLAELRVAYETWGQLNKAADNAVLIFTGLSPSAHASSSVGDESPGWWEDIIGEDRPIDTSRFFVICVNSLGSCHGSTGPASTDPQTGEPYRLNFPLLSIEDIAHAGHEVVRSLGIQRLRAVVGPSMGGMSALAYGLLYPEGAQGLLSISAAVRALPSAIAYRSLQREIVLSDSAWCSGRYEPGAGPVEGMRLARKLGMITYRSPQEWQQRFDRQRIPPGRQTDGSFALQFEIESYLEAQAQKFVGSFDANCFLYLSRAMDLFDAAEHGASLQAAIGSIRLSHALVIGVETDILFPLRQQEELAVLLKATGGTVRLEALPSLQGHDSFLVDIPRFGPAIAGFFDRL